MAGDDASNGKKSGTVKWFNSTKGFGFIASDDGEDLFVHQTSIQVHGFRSLLQGEAVEFIVEVGEDGRKRALDVTGPNGAAVQGTSRGDGYGGRGRGGGYAAGSGYGGRGSGRGGRGRGGRTADISGGGRGAGGGSFGGFNGTCYNCGEPGHMSRECTMRQSGGGGGRGGRGMMGVGRGGRGGLGRGGRGGSTDFACYSCGEVGHLQRDCPHA